ncbi:hypothetical protein ABZ930_30935 [Streptomyces sp. NPDC046716]|uniref:hypothetical protein n=1 Tax=Streptomyces sp. NPDC046716 TaxID=3157093 RepID=UPI0033D6B2C9
MEIHGRLSHRPAGGDMVHADLPDRRLIQTAVLDAADSLDPLVLPVEAIELDAFRARYRGHTFWCGSWLGGCGRQLTTKLYVDRVCHYAHHADTDEHREACGRRARGVASADHLYVRAGAEDMLRTRGSTGTARCVLPEQSGAVPLVAVSEGPGVTFHLPDATPPDWTAFARNPRTAVLAENLRVPLNVQQQVHFVHRVRCTSDGTRRLVELGTQTADGTSWYPIHSCTFTAAGLSTPALDPGRSLARPALSSPPRAASTGKQLPPEIRRLTAQIATARAARDLTQMRLLLDECDAVLARRGYHQPALSQARDAAQQWLTEHSRRDAQRGGMRLARARADEPVSRPPDRPAGASPARQGRDPARARSQTLAQLQIALDREHYGDVRVLLATLRQLPVRKGQTASPAQQELINAARAKVSDFRRLGELQEKVPRRRWITTPCPACRARSGDECYDRARGRPALHRPGGHDERLRAVLARRVRGGRRGRRTR